MLPITVLALAILYATVRLPYIEMFAFSAFCAYCRASSASVKEMLSKFMLAASALSLRFGGVTILITSSIKAPMLAVAFWGPTTPLER